MAGTIGEDELKAGRHFSDLKSRCGTFIAAGFGERYADTVTRQEVLSYLKNLPDIAPRTVRNHKTAVCTFFNWLVQDAEEIAANPVAGIKKRMLPKEKKEIGFPAPLRSQRHPDPSSEFGILN